MKMAGVSVRAALKSISKGGSFVLVGAGVAVEGFNLRTLKSSGKLFCVCVEAYRSLYSFESVDQAQGKLQGGVQWDACRLLTQI